jgi:hypothetical protein
MFLNTEGNGLKKELYVIFPSEKTNCDHRVPLMYNPKNNFLFLNFVFISHGSKFVEWNEVFIFGSLWQCTVIFLNKHYIFALVSKSSNLLEILEILL